MVNRLSSLTFASTTRIKSSLATDGRPLRGWSCTLSRPSLKFLTHYLTIPSLMALFHISCIHKTDNKPYFTVGGALDHLEHFKHYLLFSYWRLWLANE